MTDKAAQIQAAQEAANTAETKVKGNSPDKEVGEKWKSKWPKKHNQTTNVVGVAVNQDNLEKDLVNGDSAEKSVEKYSIDKYVVHKT